MQSLAVLRFDREIVEIEPVLRGGLEELPLGEVEEEVERSQPGAISAARFSISSGGTSSTWVATCHLCPKGSRNPPVRSP